MIKLKHFLEAVEKDDGPRFWIEPIGVTKDLREWCKIDQVLTHLGPPKALWEWFQEHPDEYERFRGLYHEALAKSPYRPALADLCNASQQANFTLLYEGEDPQHNTATALYEFLSALRTEKSK